MSTICLDGILIFKKEKKLFKNLWKILKKNKKIKKIKILKVLEKILKNSLDKLFGIT